MGKTALTKRSVEAARPGAADVYLWDGVIAGFGVKVTPAGRRVFLYQYRYPATRSGRTRRVTIGAFGDLTVDQARIEAKAAAGVLARGNDPFAERAALAAAEAQRQAQRSNTFKVLADKFVSTYVRPRLRSASEYERILNKYVLPKWGNKPVSEIRRATVVSLLDDVAETHGDAMADHVLAVVRKAFRWHQARDDAFTSPVVAGMKRRASKARDRVLTDDEIRAIWTATDGADPMSRLVRFLLLTAQRRDECAGAQRSEIDGNLWTIAGDRYKSGRANVVPLSRAAMAVLESAPHDGEYLFGADGSRSWSNFSAPKRDLDKRSGVTGWRLHDLRRTARTMMVRGGVRSDIAERVLGHVIPGVAGVYDRHDYLQEKRHALDVLASVVQTIIDGTGAKVQKLRAV